MLANMGHVPIAVVYHVARSRVRIVAERHRAGQRHFLRAPGSTRVVSVPFHVPSLGRARALGHRAHARVRRNCRFQVPFVDGYEEGWTP